MGKKKAEIMDEQRAGFIERAVVLGVSSEVARKTFALMEHFAGYGFNKSHSAGYALVAYHTAWLKRYYPAEFLAASLTSEMSDKDRVMILLADARRLSMRVLPPDVNLSDVAFSVQEGAIRFGLEAVKGAGHGAVEAIIEARAEGPFRDLHDFCHRIDPSRVNRKCVESLAQAGSFDTLGGHRAQILESIPSAFEWAARVRKEHSMGQESLFGGGAVEEESPRHPPLIEAQEWPSRDLLRREKDSLGFFVSGHPLEEHRRLLDSLGVLPIHLLDTLPDHESALAAGLPTQVRKSVDKRGNPIAFVSLEDFTGTVECLVFSDAYQSYGRYFDTDTPLLLRGRVSTREDQKPKIRVEEAVPLADLQTNGQLTLHLALSRSAGEDLLNDIRCLLDRHPGTSPVWMHIDHQSVEGVQVRLRATRIQACDPLLGELGARLGPRAIRLTVGEPVGTRSHEIFVPEATR
jgi:DNA polymerase-3 subunit alpha